eukprot:442409_1
MGNKGTCCKQRQSSFEEDNINQICLCGQKVTKYPYNWDQCRSCCKEIEKKEKGYYLCRAEQCTYKVMTGYHFMVCSACYESMSISNIDTKYSFLFRKVASLIEQIRKEIQKCNNNDQRRRYMYWVYFQLFRRCVAKLQKVMDETEYKELLHLFYALYGGVMDEIKSNIDSMELGLATDMFVNKKNMKRSEWV